MIRAGALLILSNVFMTIAWYGHLRHMHRALWVGRDRRELGHCVLRVLPAGAGESDRYAGGLSAAELKRVIRMALGMRPIAVVGQAVRCS